jgi:DNA polymerase III subunit epsilon
MEFVAIDLETSNADMASICQIGVVRYKNKEIMAEWTSMADPEDFFDPINISIHGITETIVTGAPTFPELYPQLKSLLQGVVCVSHTHFDRVSLDKAIRKYSLDPLGVTWLDSARVARRAWEDCAWKGYGLSNLCKKIGFEFKHHDALEDAKACGAVLNAAIAESEMDVEGWLTRVGQPIEGDGSVNKIAREGNPEGDLYGQSIVFTGTLAFPRREAATLAANVGCNVASSVTKKTDYLVVGDQDVSKLVGNEKSRKHLKAEELIAGGQNIRIMKESDFKELVDGLDTSKK